MLGHVPIEELKVTPTFSIAVEPVFGGRVRLREVTVRPREGSSYGRQPDPVDGDTINPQGIYAYRVGIIGDGIPTETRYTIEVEDRDGISVQVMLSSVDMRTLARVLRGPFNVSK